jgi:4a-hydroxytetrahydrobiopterin dehydratase
MTQNAIPLTESDLSTFLQSYPDWHVRDGALDASFKFKNFIEAFAFVSKVAIHAEKLNHHPEISIAYNKVKIGGLCTHDAGNQITSLDIDLARKISKLYV